METHLPGNSATVTENNNNNLAIQVGYLAPGLLLGPTLLPKVVLDAAVLERHLDTSRRHGIAIRHAVRLKDPETQRLGPGSKPFWDPILVGLGAFPTHFRLPILVGLVDVHFTKFRPMATWFSRNSSLPGFGSLSCRGMICEGGKPWGPLILHVTCCSGIFKYRGCKSNPSVKPRAWTQENPP